MIVQLRRERVDCDRPRPRSRHYRRPVAAGRCRFRFLTVRRGEAHFVFGDAPPCSPGETSLPCIRLAPIIGRETQYDLGQLFAWIGAASVVTLAAVVVTHVWTARSG